MTSILAASDLRKSLNFLMILRLVSIFGLGNRVPVLDQAQKWKLGKTQIMIYDDICNSDTEHVRFWICNSRFDKCTVDRVGKYLTESQNSENCLTVRVHSDLYCIVLSNWAILLKEISMAIFCKHFTMIPCAPRHLER